jgi:hypothetical protein
MEPVGLNRLSWAISFVIAFGIFMLVLTLAGCANRVEVPSDINLTNHTITSGTIETVSSGTVSFVISGDATIRILQLISADPALQQTISQSCKSDPTCNTNTMNNILGSIVSQLNTTTATR